MKKLLYLLVIAALAFPALAQVSVVGPSAANSASAGLIRSEKDDFLDPASYSSIAAPTLFLQYGMPGPDSDQRVRAAAGLPLGSIYLGFFAGLASSTNGAPSQGQTTAQTWTYDAFGNLVSTQNATTPSASWTSMQNDTVTALVGFKLGGLALGVSNSFILSSSTGHGDYSAAYTLPTTGAWNYATIAAPVSGGTTSTLITDASGAVFSKVSSAFGAGYDKGTTGEGFTDTLGAGIRTALGAGSLAARFAVGLDSRDFGAYAQAQTSTQQPGKGYASYTPPAGASMDGAALSDASAFGYYEATTSSKILRLTPGAGASLAFPLAGTALPATLELGATASYGMGLRSGDYTSTDGSSVSLSGSATTWHSAALSTAAGTVTPATTRTETRYWVARAYTSDSKLAASLPVFYRAGVDGKDNFGFGIGLAPSLTLDSQAYTTTGGSTRRTVYENGNGITTGDASDYVTIETLALGSTGYEQSVFAVDTVFSTGAWFYLKPQSLRVNLGGQATWSLVDRTTTTNTTDSASSYKSETTYGDTTLPLTTSFQKSQPAAQSKTVADSAGLTVSYTAGLTYFFSERMKADFYYTGAGSTGNILEPGSWTLELVIKP